MKIVCAHCGKTSERPAGHVNRANARGLRLYCNRRCSGLGRRNHKTKAQRVEEKRLYDLEYRRKNRGMLKAKKRAYFVQTYDPVKARVERKKRAKQHAEYCRRPEYKAWKRWYDAGHRAKQYGDFADAYRTVLELNREIKRRIGDYEKRQQNQTLNKAQERRRQAQSGADRYSSADRGRPERRAVGNADRLAP